MGSYAECWVNDFYIGASKNDVNPEIMQLFRESDRKTVSASSESLPKRLSRVKEYLEGGENFNVVYYSISVGELRDRLDLVGYSLHNSKVLFQSVLEQEISTYERWIEEDVELSSYSQEKIDILREMTSDKWILNLQELYRSGKSKFDIDQGSYDGLMRFMLEEDWYGFPEFDFNIPLRLVLEVVPEDHEVIYDVTELILSEYLNEEDDLVEHAFNLFYRDLYQKGRCIILTEGKFDTYVLSESLRILYPHLADYFSFIDFDGAKVGGGAGSLANMVKTFSGAGIVNKIIAVFDNDTAARSALRGLAKASVSKNIKIITLPNLPVLEDYPTLGPSGMVSMDVNGLSGSIEPYLGADCLESEDGSLYPVKWTGLDAGIQEYQGEMTSKDKIQKKFKEKLNCCKRDNSLISEYDWSGLNLIFENIFKLFHEDDGRKMQEQLKDLGY